MERSDIQLRNIGGTGRPRVVRFIAMVFALGLALPAFAAAEALPRHPGPDPMMKHDGQRTAEVISERAEELGIDAETTAKIQEIVKSSRERGEELRFELDAAHRKLSFMLTRDEPVEEEVLAQAQSIGEIRIEESKHRLRSLLAIRSLLTPEQREELAQKRMSERGSELREVCEEDIQRLCGDAERGLKTMMCMREHRDELSEKCSVAIEDAKEKRGGGSHDGWNRGRSGRDHGRTK